MAGGRQSPSTEGEGEASGGTRPSPPSAEKHTTSVWRPIAPSPSEAEISAPSKSRSKDGSSPLLTAEPEPGDAKNLLVYPKELLLSLRDLVGRDAMVTKVSSLMALNRAPPGLEGLLDVPPGCISHEAVHHVVPMPADAGVAPELWQTWCETEAQFEEPRVAGDRLRSWGKGAEYSQLLTRMRRASGGTVPLALLREEAPIELRKIMKDAAAFSAWLAHRTGLIEVSGSPGQEMVTLTLPRSEPKAPAKASISFALNPQATEFLPVFGFAFDPWATEFVPTDDADTATATGVEQPLPVFDVPTGTLEQEEDADANALLPCAMAAAALLGSENMTVAEAHELLRKTNFGNEVAPVENFENFDSSFDSFERFKADLFGWDSSQQMEAMDLIWGTFPADGLNPQAVEFQPTAPTGVSAKGRSGGSSSRKAIAKHRFQQTRPEAIPEESEESTAVSTNDAASDEEEGVLQSPDAAVAVVSGA
eukprot:CAMPEP_0115083498 /NCGR_PEP_ID=MMETSP0227-20121206/20596_1 /TAXON_ID=89957 /ORGANISM="Polarella glacialis, Strain CCMP 1383" /LENGTH=477 /DNA_ID=CAMNT_0002471917 /DNA_START=74 /DNA_END=1507 /DNA_ORIENTATION=+